MTKYSEDEFCLLSHLTPNEIIGRLEEHTLKKKWLSMTPTKRAFIGQIDGNKFSVISSSFPFPYGAACVVRGKVGPGSQIAIVTTLHNVFKFLFFVFLFSLVFVSPGLIISYLNESGTLQGAFMIVLIIAAVIVVFRLYLHGMYVWARKDILKRLIMILEIKNCDGVGIEVGKSDRRAGSN